MYQTFSLKDLGTLSYFLVVQVSYTIDVGTFLSQSIYMRDLLHKAKFLDANQISAPMVTVPILLGGRGMTFSEPNFYRSIVGGLQYITITCIEISYCGNKGNNLG